MVNKLSYLLIFTIYQNNFGSFYMQYMEEDQFLKNRQLLYKAQDLTLLLKKLELIVKMVYQNFWNNNNKRTL